MQNTIYESFELPSKGLVYDTPINPHITLSSMTTAEEMQRLSPTSTPYKVMSDIIEECMKDKPDIHVYDMCIGDYQFLLHKLRIVTYGPSYLMDIRCPNCGEITSVEADLESLEVREWSEDLINHKRITLPKTGRVVDLKLQTPRDLDTIDYKAKELANKTKTNLSYKFLFTIMSNIGAIDGRDMNSMQLEAFVRELPLNDANFILNRANDLAERVGLDTMIHVTCPKCGYELVTPFRITSEFFGPTNY